MQKNGKKEEFWDLYSEKTDRVVTQIRKGSLMIQPGYYHISVEVIPTDMQGHLLITRRSMTKILGAGKYEFPAGSALAGETPQAAAKRELFEETGLKATRLHKVGEGRIIGMRRFVYVAEIPNLLTTEVTLQEEETIDYRFVSYGEWLDLLGKNIFDAERGVFYTAALYERVKKLVGVSEEKAKPAETEPLTLRPAEKLVGSRRGTSGRDMYPPEIDGTILPLQSFDEETEDD